MLLHAMIMCFSVPRKDLKSMSWIWMSWMAEIFVKLFPTHRYDFYWGTGETPETLIQKLNLLGNRIQKVGTRGHRHLPDILSPRLLLVIWWLRTHSWFSILFLLTDVSSVINNWWHGNVVMGDIFCIGLPSNNE